MGVSTALDTLGSQAYGEGNAHGVISCCVSAISVLSLLCIPVGVAMLTADSVSQAIFRQSPEGGAVSYKATVVLLQLVKSPCLCQSVRLQLVGVFCQGLLPGLLPLVWSIAILKVSSQC